jgi:hypothetical protein
MACARALAVDVLKAVVCEERVGPLWGIAVVGRFVPDGDGEGHFRLESSQAVLQRENVFRIRLDEGWRWEVPQESDGKEMITWPRAQTKMTAGTRRAD